MDTSALLRALDSGRCGFAALDVVEEEKGVFGHAVRREALCAPLAALAGHPRVLLSPHIAYYTLPGCGIPWNARSPSRDKGKGDWKNGSSDGGDSFWRIV